MKPIGLTRGSSYGRSAEGANGARSNALGRQVNADGMYTAHTVERFSESLPALPLSLNADSGANTRDLRFHSRRSPFLRQNPVGEFVPAKGLLPWQDGF